MAKENGWGLAGSHVTEETLYIDGADLGGYSSVPPLVEDKNVQTRQRRDTFDHEGVYLGYGNVDTILPYVRQEWYTPCAVQKGIQIHCGGKRLYPGGVFARTGREAVEADRQDPAEGTFVCQRCRSSL